MSAQEREVYDIGLLTLDVRHRSSVRGGNDLIGVLKMRQPVQVGPVKADGDKLRPGTLWLSVEDSVARGVEARLRILSAVVARQHLGDDVESSPLLRVQPADLPAERDIVLKAPLGGGQHELLPIRGPRWIGIPPWSRGQPHRSASAQGKLVHVAPIEVRPGDVCEPAPIGRNSGRVLQAWTISDRLRPFRREGKTI